MHAYMHTETIDAARHMSRMSTLIYMYFSFVKMHLKRGGQLGLKEVVIGMPHRGRLNVLHNVLSKPFRAIISEFLDNPANPIEAGGSGEPGIYLTNDKDWGTNPCCENHHLGRVLTTCGKRLILRT